VRSLRLLAALALTVAATLTSTAAQAAPGDGTLTVTLVDENGAPMPGAIAVLAGAGGSVASSQALSTATFTLPPGPYGVLAITPWGGMVCDGVDECDYLSVLSGVSPPNGDLTVLAGQDSPVTLTGTYPARITGTGRIGSPLSVEYSDSMDDMLDYFASVAGVSLAPTVTWLRNGAPIAGADDLEYTPVGADVGAAISARLAYTGFALTQFQMVTGQPVTPRTTNAITVSKVPTKTFAILSNPVVKAGNHGKVRVEVTAKNLVVTGKVTVTLGDWSQTRTLRNGTTRVLLPALKPGKYAVGARFLGSRAYAPSKGDNRTLTVTR
jgi:hypothetical protein